MFVKNFGYRFGMRQRSIPVTLEFYIPDQLSIELLDIWLEEALEIDSKQYNLIFSNQKRSGALEALYLKRLLHTTTVLLQDIFIPIFEHAAVIDIQKNSIKKHGYIAKLWFPIIEGFPTDFFLTWLKLSNELIHTYFQLLNKNEEVETFYQKFHNEYILPWAKKVPAGKSTVPILQAAFELGIPFLHLGMGRYLLGWGSQSKIFDRSSNSHDSAIGSWASHNKHIALNIMRHSGIPVPNGVTFNSSQKLDISYVSHLTKPLVIKPVDRDRGEGVTLGINSQEQFESAMEIARKLSQTVLVEEQVAGTCYRVLVVNEKIIYVVKRNPKGVTGDGVSDIETLVSRTNKEIRKKMPRKRLPEIHIDQQVTDYLAQAGLRITSVPKQGKKVDFRPAQSTQWGGDPEEVTNQLHSDNAEICIRAAQSLKLSCAGVDFISTDITVPWYKNNAVINEVNFAPVIGRTHAYQRDAAHYYLKELFPSNGRIPIDVFIGAGSQGKAFKRWQEQAELGKRCFFISDTEILNYEEKPFFTAGAQTIFAKVSSLLTMASIDAIVIQTSDKNIFAESGYPFEPAITKV